MTFPKWMEPLFIAGMLIGAKSMPDWVIGWSVLIFLGLAGWIYWKEKK